MNLHAMLRARCAAALRWWSAGRVAAALLSLTVVALVMGCGGGGSTTTAGVGSGGTGSYASGPVSGFGSIIVNGVRYDVTQAGVTDGDGQAQTSADVLLGMTVDVRAAAVSNGQAVAQSVQYRSELLGPIAFAPGASSFTVLGQTVTVTAKTFYGNGLTGLAALAAGNVVEVYGLSDGQGAITATRIELKAPDVSSYGGDVFRLRGVAHAVDLSARHFVVGAAHIAYGSDALQTSLVEGALVSLRLSKAQVSGYWVATSIQAGAGRVADSEQAQVEGLIAQVIDGTHFVVNGLTVEASAAVQAGAGGSLSVGQRVEVDGVVSADVLIASAVRIDTESGTENIELHGTVSSLDAIGRTFVVRGTTVDYGGITPSGGSLVNGACVEVQGSQIVSGSQLQASQVEIHDPTDCH